MRNATASAAPHTEVLQRLFDQGRLAEVVTQADVMTRRYPHFAFGWKALGTALQQLGKV